MKKKSLGLVAILCMLLTVLPAFAPQKTAAASPYADGEYTLPFSVLKDSGSEPSAAAEYVVSPAKLIVQNGKMHVVMTLNNSSWWQYFKVNSADVQVLSEDSSNDKRVVKFEVNTIDQLVSAKIHVIVTGIPGFTYDNKYDIRFNFNSKNIPLAPVVEKPTPKPIPTPTPTPKPTVKPSGSEQAATTPSQKPSDAKEEIKQEPVTKVEETTIQTKEEVASKEEPVVEKKEAPTEPTEPSNDELEASESTNLETKEQVEVMKPVGESAAEEVKAESTSNSTPMIFIILLVFAIFVGAVILFKKKRK